MENDHSNELTKYGGGRLEGKSELSIVLSLYRPQNTKITVAIWGKNRLKISKFKVLGSF